MFSAEKKLLTNDIAITAETLKNEILRIRLKERMLIPIFQEHNNRVEALLGQEFVPRTLERYKTSLKHTQEFIQWKYNLSDVSIKMIDHAFITDFYFYSRSIRKYSNNTMVNYI